LLIFVRQCMSVSQGFSQPYIMSYQYPSPWFAGNGNDALGDAKLQHQDVLSVDDAPTVIWMPMLVPVENVFPHWGYPQIFYHHGPDAHSTTWPLSQISTDVLPNLEDVERPDDNVEPAGSCSSSADLSDSFSDASTDVGDGEDIADDFEEEPRHFPIQGARQVEIAAAPGRPIFSFMISRQQRVDQLRRVIDEYCALEFDSVDATSQGALAYRMLTVLKSLSEATTFHGEEGRCKEKRLHLLGLGKDDEDAIRDAVDHAQGFCDKRSFRDAFKVLKQMAPRLSGKALHSPKSKASEETEAMKQRRLDKRQRQRQERRVQRAGDRANRTAQRCCSASSSAAASCQAAGVSCVNTLKHSKT